VVVIVMLEPKQAPFLNRGKHHSIDGSVASPDHRRHGARSRYQVPF
jgi:hypothetical protein